MAYSGATLPPSNVDRAPSNVTVGILQHGFQYVDLRVASLARLTTEKLPIAFPEKL